MLATFRSLTPALLAASLVASIGCRNSSPLAPSPIILPDAVTVPVGQSQTFTVLNAAVTEFTVRSDAGDWRQFVQIDEVTPDSISLIALKPSPGGYVYVTADLGARRSPLVAVMAIK